MSRKVTSQDVARAAGVSQSAVSRVFSGASASKNTQAKVRQAAADLGYRPNVLARSLITGQSKIIGLVVAYLDNQFYPDALQRFSNALHDLGYHILIFTAKTRGEGVDDLIGRLLDYQVDGIICASVGVSDELTSRVEAAGIPMLLFNRGQTGSPFAQVTSDNLSGSHKIAEYLVRGGHERFGHVAGWLGSSTGQQRAKGFNQGLEAHGAHLSGQRDGLYSREAAAQAARELVEQERCDALFVSNDHMAFAVLDELRVKVGVKVPEEVSVVGYDDVPMAAWASYDLTTYRQPSNRMVAAAVETMIKLIAGEVPETKEIEIPGALIERSTARWPKE
ncbi:MAG: LacI family DNA-binding transcriptional regulator [Pseudomonadota bacterium]